MIQIGSLFTHRSLAIVYLIVMCTQILFVEGFGVSPLKIVLMSLAPFILTTKVPYLSKAFLIGTLYIIVVFFCATMQSYVRVSTIGYLFMFVITFIMYYNLVYDGAFSFDDYRKLLQVFIWAFFYCAVLQQLFSAVGLRYMPVLNMVGQTYLSPIHFNTLTFKPSSSARILAFLFLGFLRMEELYLGNKPSFRYLWDNHRKIVFAFLYVMLFMGSGTAIIALILLSLYFIEKKYIVHMLLAFSLGYAILTNVDYLPAKRMLVTVNAVMTLDVNEITIADNSAAARINPLVNTLTNTDLTSSETWFGKGTVSVEQRNNWYSTLKTAKMGNIDQYGLISFIVAISLIFMCCIPRFLSVETLLAFFLIGMTINNFSYIWGCYFILATTKYFYNNYTSDEQDN